MRRRKRFSPLFPPHSVRVKGLTALYLPGAGRARVPQPPNTVNTLRFVFNHLDLPYQFEKMRVR